MTVLTTDNNGIGAILCACGNPVASHACPTVYAPRSAKGVADNCPACGFKRHANMDVATVRFECQWRQWSHAVGKLQVRHGKTIRYTMPPFTVANVLAFSSWLATGANVASASVPDVAHATTMDAQAPETTSAAKRAATRAASAPPQPTVPTAPLNDASDALTTRDGLEDAADIMDDIAADDAMVIMDDAPSSPDVPSSPDDPEGWEF